MNQFPPYSIDLLMQYQQAATSMCVSLGLSPHDIALGTVHTPQARGMAYAAIDAARKDTP